MRARDLFYAMWVPDLFMKRVQEDGNWTLMCPNECPDCLTHIVMNSINYTLIMKRQAKEEKQ